MKIQTIIMVPENDSEPEKEFKIDNLLYQPVNTVIIKEREFPEWTQYDEFYPEGWLVRTIWLKED